MIRCSSHLNLLLIPIALVLLSLVTIKCQTSTSPQTSTSLSIATTTTTTTTTSKPATSSDSNLTATISPPINITIIPTIPPTAATTQAPTTTSEVLLSGNEFVDYTEAPTLLFDGISNITTTAASITTTALSQEPPKNMANISTSISEITTTTISPAATSSTSSTEVPVVEITDDVETKGDDTESSTGNDEDISSGGNANDSKDGADADQQQQAPYEPPKNVSQYMDYIERLFHDLRHQITDLFEPHIPQLIRTSQMVQLTGSCSYDMLRMAFALRQFEPWALRMIDSSGKVPEGIFEGSFTALGSYDECISTVFASKGDHQSPQPTQGKYCLVNVSPFLPPKPPADKVELMFQEEANRRNYTKDDQFSRLSPMFYYMKFRIGVCIPSTCIDSDLDSISSALSSSLRLNITIPNCRIKQSLPITSHQLAGGIIFALVFVLVCGATLMDYWRRKLDRLKRHERLLILDVQTKQPSKETSLIGSTHFQTPTSGNTVAWHQKHCDISYTGASKATNCISDDEDYQATKFNQRLEKHWCWMSFSLLTNFKLHFKRKPSTANLITRQQSDKDSRTDGEPSAMVIRCLNGIRVISLCWVIVANSYITLDPRATKRLTKTREAPKDFLFQLVAQASLAIETFFFLSGVLLSLSFARQLRPKINYIDHTGEKSSATRSSTNVLQWIRFYVHRYVRMTPATMLVIAFTMFAFRYGDGPLWFEATHKAHLSCSQNWWRHLLHVANFIDTRQMCFIHYWYIAADMQLFLFAPILMFLLYKCRRMGYTLAALIGSASIGFVFYTTYSRNLPPTLLFYNSDPESRREFGNSIMTKPLTHALPYMVGMLVGKWLATGGRISIKRPTKGSLHTLFKLLATLIALAEVFLPYKWNNSHLPTRFLAALYASLFRLCWSLVLAYLVISCAHPRGKRCPAVQKRRNSRATCLNCHSNSNFDADHSDRATKCAQDDEIGTNQHGADMDQVQDDCPSLCFCGNGGNLVNRLLSLNVFAHLSRLSFVAYLIHLPLMSVFIAQTRGLFAFSHTLVIHLALSYLVMTFILSFVLVHIIEFPFITFERYLFKKIFCTEKDQETKQATTAETTTAKRKRKRDDYKSHQHQQPAPVMMLMATTMTNNSQWVGERSRDDEHKNLQRDEQKTSSSYHNTISSSGGNELSERL